MFDPCDSIMICTKRMLGMDDEYNAFDTDILNHINSVLLILCQLGVGPEKPFEITGEEETWADFWGEIQPINLARSYMYQKVRLMFDPPSTGVLHEALERQVKETEWRLAVESDHNENEVVTNDQNGDGHTTDDYINN